jgi:GNAT superfamily N-acetyltransferase
MPLTIKERPMTDREYQREQIAFDDHGLEYGNPKDEQERFGFVAEDDGKFIGASSGLAQKYGETYGNYFYLSDLLVEKEYRGKGYGIQLLKLLEDRVQGLGISYIWTWTAEYEASTFYIKHGYEVFARQERFYYSGHARVGLVKKL